MEKTKSSNAREHFFGAGAKNYGYSNASREKIIDFFDLIINNDYPFNVSDIMPPKGFPYKKGMMTYKTYLIENDKIVEKNSSVEWHPKKGWVNHKLERYS